MNKYKLLELYQAHGALRININAYYYCPYPIFYGSEDQGLKEIEPDSEKRYFLHYATNSPQIV